MGNDEVDAPRHASGKSLTEVSPKRLPSSMSPSTNGASGPVLMPGLNGTAAYAMPYACPTLIAPQNVPLGSPAAER